MEPSKTILTAQEVSECLRISLSTVHHLTRTGKIKGVKMGKQWRYVREDIERCLIPDLEIPPPPRFPPQKSERRTSRRISCYLPAGAVLNPSPQRKWSGKGVVLNISRGGLLLQSEETASSEAMLCLNDLLLLNLRLPMAAIRYGSRLAGHIVHLDGAGKRRIGIKFDNPSPELEKAILDYIG